jgi:hypothetical protein
VGRVVGAGSDVSSVRVFLKRKAICYRKRGAPYRTQCCDILFTALWLHPFHCETESSWASGTQCMTHNNLARTPEGPAILECAHKEQGVNWSKYTLSPQKKGICIRQLNFIKSKIQLEDSLVVIYFKTRKEHVFLMPLKESKLLYKDVSNIFLVL